MRKCGKEGNYPIAIAAPLDWQQRTQRMMIGGKKQIIAHALQALQMEDEPDRAGDVLTLSHGIRALNPLSGISTKKQSASQALCTEKHIR